MIYKVATGLDIPLVSLVSMVPQPRSEGIKVTQRSFASSGAISNQGLYIELEWTMLTTDEEYQTLLTAFGLLASYYAAVTVYIPTDTFVSARYNGIAIRPEIGKDARRTNYFVRDVTILVRDLEVSV